jgi:hypothetical protein
MIADLPARTAGGLSLPPRENDMDGVRPQSPGAARWTGIILGTVAGGFLGLWCAYRILKPDCTAGLLDDRLVAYGPGPLLRQVWLLCSCLTGGAALAGGLLAAGLAAALADFGHLRRAFPERHIRILPTYTGNGGTGPIRHSVVSPLVPPPHNVV